MNTTRTAADERVPDDDRRCVWMCAGLVAWKLCDRDFDCEHCPFDRAMRGGDASPSPGPATPRTAAGDTAEARARSQRQLAELLAEAASVLGDAGAGVGPTLPDGGQPVADLRTALGAERYRRLLLRLLG